MKLGFKHSLLDYRYDDGGRMAAGFKGQTGDCGTRAYAIASDRPYKEVYDEMIQYFRENEKASRRRRGSSHPRTGIHSTTMRSFLKEKGWVWTPTMHIGQGCQVHMRRDEVPMEGPVILTVSKHFVTLIDGVIHDIYDPSRGGNRCVYGYLTPPHSNS